MGLQFLIVSCAVCAVFFLCNWMIKNQPFFPQRYFDSVNAASINFLEIRVRNSTQNSSIYCSVFFKDPIILITNKSTPVLTHLSPNISGDPTVDMTMSMMTWKIGQSCFNLFHKISQQINTSFHVG